MTARLNRYFLAPALAVFVCLTAAISPSHAQSPVIAKAQAAQAESQKKAVARRQMDQRKTLEDAGLTPAQIDDLIATLESPDARDRLISRLKGLRAVAGGKTTGAADANAAANEAGGAGRVFALLSDRVELISSQLVAGAAVLLDAPRLATWVQQQLSNPSSREIWLRVLWKVLIVLAAGFAAEALWRRLLRGARKSVESRSHDALWLKLTMLVARTILDITPIAAFGAAAYVVLPLLDPSDVSRLVAIALINASVLARAVMAAARMFFAPTTPYLRIIRLTDETANYLVIWIRRFANVAVYGFFLSQAALLLGLPPGGYAALTKAVGLLLALLSMIFILQNRRVVANAIQGRPDAGTVGIRLLRRRFADIWHVLAIIYVFALYIVWALEIQGGFDFVFRASALSIVILIAAKLLILASQHAMNAGFGIPADLIQRFPGLSQRANRYFAVIYYVISGVIVLFASFSVLEAWGVDAFAWVGTPVGRRVTGSAITIAFVCILSILVWEMISSVIERYLSRDGNDDGKVAISARAKTLLPLVRKAGLIIISTIAGFIVLSEVGVNIGPLLAGAGVVGLAVGFGSQTLVKDVITGLFILAENQFAVGDVIQVSGKSGLVEAITIRTIRLRDLAGNVHMIPYSAVDTVENMTKDFSRYVFDVGVAYREDIDEVIEVLRGLGEEMQADEYYGDLILSPLEILGLDSFGDSAIIVRARFTTKPIKQWEVGREFNRRMKRKFDELNIEIPFPHQTIYFGEGKTGGAPPAFVQIEESRGPAGKGDDTGGPKPSGEPKEARTDPVDNVAPDDDGH